MEYIVWRNSFKCVECPQKAVREASNPFVKGRPCCILDVLGSAQHEQAAA